MRLKTGWHEIDQMIGGLLPGEIMILAGLPGAGRTAFCLSAALHAIENNKKALILGSEAPPGCLDKRLAGLDKKVPLYVEYTAGVFLEEKSEAIPSELELKLQYYAYELPEEETKNLDPVEKYTREISPWLCVIDPIDYVYKYYPKQGDYEIIRCGLLEKAVRQIKRLAIKYRAAVIITARALGGGPAGTELSREVACCAPLAEYLCLLEKEGERVICQVLKSPQGESGVFTLGGFAGKKGGDHAIAKENLLP